MAGLRGRKFRISTRFGQSGQGTWVPGVRGLVRGSPLVPAIAVICYSASGDIAGGSTFLSVLAVGLAAASAALVAGALLGFLFGLPRTLERSDSKARLAPNTNLDQISDWLTKILVGLGLVQLGKVTHGVGTIARSLAPGLGNGPGAKAFASTLLIYSAGDGFLLGYIWTRVDLSRRFRQAAEDLDPIEKVTEKTLSAPPPTPPSPLD
jgi:hypothetical protein